MRNLLTQLLVFSRKSIHGLAIASRDPIVIEIKRPANNLNEDDKEQSILYARLYDERPSDLTGLCGGCHLTTEEERRKREGRTPWHRRVYAYGVKVYGRDCAKTFPINRLYGQVMEFSPS